MEQNAPKTRKENADFFYKGIPRNHLGVLGGSSQLVSG